METLSELINRKVKRGIEIDKTVSGLNTYVANTIRKYMLKGYIYNGITYHTMNNRSYKYYILEKGSDIITINSKGGTNSFYGLCNNK